jgi:malonate decarboxylase alpha subunit
LQIDLAAAPSSAIKAGREASNGQGNLTRGRKLVVQMLETFGEKMKPNFVERLDSVELAEKLNFDRKIDGIFQQQKGGP